MAGWDKREGGSVYALPLGGTLIKVPFSIGGPCIFDARQLSLCSLEDHASVLCSANASPLQAACISLQHCPMSKLPLTAVAV